MGRIIMKKLLKNLNFSELWDIVYAIVAPWLFVAGMWVAIRLIAQDFGHVLSNNQIFHMVGFIVVLIGLLRWSQNAN